MLVEMRKFLIIVIDSSPLPSPIIMSFSNGHGIRWVCGSQNNWLVIIYMRGCCRKINQIKSVSAFVLITCLEMNEVHSICEYKYKTYHNVNILKSYVEYTSTTYTGTN